MEEQKTCKAEVYEERTITFRKCSRKAGYGPNGDYCKTHAKQFDTEVKRIAFFYFCNDNAVYRNWGVGTIGIIEEDKRGIRKCSKPEYLARSSGNYFSELQPDQFCEVSSIEEAFACIEKKLLDNIEKEEEQLAIRRTSLEQFRSMKEIAILGKYKDIHR